MSLGEAIEGGGKRVKQRCSRKATQKPHLRAKTGALKMRGSVPFAGKSSDSRSPPGEPARARVASLGCEPQVGGTHTPAPLRYGRRGKIMTQARGLGHRGVSGARPSTHHTRCLVGTESILGLRGPLLPFGPLRELQPTDGIAAPAARTTRRVISRPVGPSAPCGVDEVPSRVRRAVLIPDDPSLHFSAGSQYQKAAHSPRGSHLGSSSRKNKEKKLPRATNVERDIQDKLVVYPGDDASPPCISSPPAASPTSDSHEPAAVVRRTSNPTGTRYRTG